MTGDWSCCFFQGGQIYKMESNATFSAASWPNEPVFVLLMEQIISMIAGFPYAYAVQSSMIEGVSPAPTPHTP